MIVVHSAEFYWGVEEDLTDERLVTRAWLVEDLEPFRRSLWGIRIRVGRRAFHFGRCERSEDPRRRMPEVDIEEISAWIGPHNAPTQDAAATGAESNGSLVGGDTVTHSGSSIGVVHTPVLGTQD